MRLRAKTENALSQRQSTHDRITARASERAYIQRARRRTTSHSCSVRHLISDGGVARQHRRRRRRRFCNKKCNKRTLFVCSMFESNASRGSRKACLDAARRGASLVGLRGARSKTLHASPCFKGTSSSRLVSPRDAAYATSWELRKGLVLWVGGLVAFGRRRPQEHRTHAPCSPLLPPRSAPPCLQYEQCSSRSPVWTTLWSGRRMAASAENPFSYRTPPPSPRRICAFRRQPHAASQQAATAEPAALTIRGAAAAQPVAASSASSVSKPAP